MLGAYLCLGLLPALVACSGEGNLHLLEDEIAAAMGVCIIPSGQRQRRSASEPLHIDGSSQELNQYSHERRNTSDLREQIHVLNATDVDYDAYSSPPGAEKLVNSVARPAGNRSRRSGGGALLATPDADQCLSQCIFANLQVVDARGIPRESELWNRIQASVTSQQSRGALRDQTRACFQELQSESEGDGCSYSNKLERCLMLRFSERKPASNATNPETHQNS